MPYACRLFPLRPQIKKMAIRIRYNAPVILTLSLLAIAILLLNASLMPRLTYQYFAVGGAVNWTSVADWFRLFSHVLGHGSWAQLTANLAFILLLGPMLEARYGSGRILLLILIAALAAGLLNVLFFKATLMGASGIVFMLILLAAMADIRAGILPLTFVLLAVIFLSHEVTLALRDNIAQLVQLLGGAVGAIVGLLLRR
jgi:membrane associated rhomboid family serine protease